MKILILDDMQERHDYFKQIYEYHNLTHVYTAKECINLLNTQSFDMVTLDHDLGGKQMVDSSEEDTGYTVAKWLEEFNDKQPEVIYLHSLNPVGRKNMKAALPRAIENPCYDV